MYFNTTLVSVRQSMVFVLFGSFRDFNTTLVSVRHYTAPAVVDDNKFQYNTCFGSTNSKPKVTDKKLDFNTTLVSVRPRS